MKSKNVMVFNKAISNKDETIYLYLNSENTGDNRILDFYVDDLDSSTKYGMRVLNPLISSVEERYLAARIVLSQSGSAIATRKLMRCLNDNGIISVTGNNHSNNCSRLPFLNTDIDIAVGAPRLALKTGAALLPVFTIRDDEGGFLVSVGSEIAMPADGSAKERINAAVGDYLKRLTPFVEQHPAQWRSWYQ